MMDAPKTHRKIDRIGNALKAGAVVAAVALVALAAHHGDLAPPEPSASTTTNEIAGTAVAPDAHYLPSQFDEMAKAPDPNPPAPTF